MLFFSFFFSSSIQFHLINTSMTNVRKINDHDEWRTSETRKTSSNSSMRNFLSSKGNWLDQFGKRPFEKENHFFAGEHLTKEMFHHRSDRSVQRRKEETIDGLWHRRELTIGVEKLRLICQWMWEFSSRMVVSSSSSSSSLSSPPHTRSEQEMQLEQAVTLSRLFSFLFSLLSFLSLDFSSFSHFSRFSYSLSRARWQFRPSSLSLFFFSLARSLVSLSHSWSSMFGRGRAALLFLLSSVYSCRPKPKQLRTIVSDWL